MRIEEKILKNFETNLLQGPYAPVVEHGYLQRLKKISFTGTMPIVYPIVRDSSRYDHSIGVAYLASLMSKRLSYDIEKSNLFLLFGLLHDVGHGALSHATEVFLAKKFSFYHEGRSSVLLRNKSFVDLLSKIKYFKGNEKKIISQICTLLTNENNYNFPLLGTAISIDTLDGTIRSRECLNLPTIDVRLFLKNIQNEKSTVLLNFEGVQFLKKFWAMELELYSKYIYTDEILSAEAMLTRMLERTFNKPEEARQVYTMTDDELHEVLMNSIMSSMAKQLWRKQLFKPLSKIDPSYFNHLSNRFDLANENSSERLLLERDIAMHFQIDPEEVIFHTSFIRHFYTKQSTEVDELSYYSVLSTAQRERKINLDLAVNQFCRKRKTNMRTEIFISSYTS